jgi:DNA-binding NarL/FixJ family response regulator
VLTDIRMPPGHHMEGIDAAHDIRREHPGVVVVVLSQHTDETYAFALLRDGTDGLAYLLKTGSEISTSSSARCVPWWTAGRSSTPSSSRASWRGVPGWRSHRWRP